MRVSCSAKPELRGSTAETIGRDPYQLPVAPKEAIARVEDGNADYATEAVTPRSARRLASRDPGPRYRIESLLGTDSPLQYRPAGLLVARLRRAVNFAIDRRASAQAGAIGNGLRPVRQTVRASGMPGFVDANVYQFEPDVRKARPQACGTSATDGEPLHAKGDTTEQLAEIVRSTLKTIGMNVDVTTIHTFEVFGRTRALGCRPRQLVRRSTRPDRFPSVLRQPAFGPRVPNLGRFSDPGYNRRIDAANGLVGAERRSPSGGSTLMSPARGRRSPLQQRVPAQLLLRPRRLPDPPPVTGINLAALCIRGQD